MPLFQVALDLWEREKALTLAQRLLPYVDILEVGTPLLLSCGLFFVESLRKVAGKKLIFVDAKIVDAGEEEARAVFERGGDIVSVLGGASRTTLEGVKRAAQAFGKRWAVDTIDLLPNALNVPLLEELKPDFLGLHVPHDVVFGDPKAWERVTFPLSFLRKFPLLVAGGITPEVLPLLLETFRPEVVVVGSAVTKSPFPEKVAERVRRILDAFPGKDS
ncbi:MAG: orotidine 5'-phosphate decarboxylase [Candidatus Caldatribacterium sp.]|nr:orotidine 5'-phosphate decarboxylase [Candidatus Caldatribacterium sp.]